MHWGFTKHKPTIPPFKWFAWYPVVAAKEDDLDLGFAWLEWVMKERKEGWSYFTYKLIE